MYLCAKIQIKKNMSMKQETNHSPVDRVVDYIKTQIAEKQVNPGDRLPSERKLSELLKVGRPHIRAALQKLETYGVVETRPQSGTIVTEFSKSQIDNLFNETLKVDKYDFYSLVHVREWVESYWKACYALITRTNNVLASVQVVKNEANKKMYEGEARFLRALEYFNLVRLWGPVFIVTSKTPSDVARNMQRSSVSDVYALIEGDLETIVDQQLLPAKQTDALLGRADMNAAKALLAKVYATHYAVGDEKYQQALNLLVVF
jgi:starch-binding outer membrane protein, SusD/RagB family